MTIQYDKVLIINYPDSLWHIKENNYDTLEWRSKTPKPTKAELDSLWESTEKIIVGQQMDIERRAAYVFEADPLFFKAQRGEATMEEWQAKVADIKARFPK
jgi:hypothetical protein